jgi:cytidylate kinase
VNGFEQSGKTVVAALLRDRQFTHFWTLVTMYRSLNAVVVQLKKQLKTTETTNTTTTTTNNNNNNNNNNNIKYN